MTGLVLIADCEVEYVGRGKSTLNRGIYLIIIKPDGSIQIHSSRLIKPKNYMGCGTKIDISEDKIFAKKGKEHIEITIFNELSKNQIATWDDKELLMARTESELAEELFNELRSIYKCHTIIREFDTKEVGSIDVLRISDCDEWHIYEVKRKTASISSISQVLRYMECISARGHLVQGYIVAPSITINAKSLADKHNIKVIIKDFIEVMAG